MAAAQGKTNWFAIGISAAVVVVLLALGGVVVWMNNQANDPGAAPAGSEIFNAETGAITYGDGEDVVSVFLDFQCPACKSFEEQVGPSLEKAVDDGKITVEYHPIAILDRFSQGTDYSSRSAGAAVCVAENDPDKYLEYAAMLFANQPAENTSGLTNEQLVGFAEQVGADSSIECITDETYRKYGAAQAKAHEVGGTPTVEINGERLDLQNQADMQKLTELLG